MLVNACNTPKTGMLWYCDPRNNRPPAVLARRLCSESRISIENPPFSSENLALGPAAREMNAVFGLLPFAFTLNVIN